MRGPLRLVLALASIILICRLSESFSPPQDCTMAKVALVTGATGQIGRSIALQVAKSGYKTLLTCRDAARGEKLVAEIAKESGGDVAMAPLVDLSSVASIAAMATSISKDYPVLHLLINNAAVVEKSRVLTKEGLEMQFAVNVQAYYSLMQTLAPNLKAAMGARVVNVASEYAGHLDATDLQFESRAYDETTAYKQSKQANRMLTASAVKHLFAPDSMVLVNACHPGVTTSPLLKNLGMASGWDAPEKSAANPLFLAMDASLEGKTGGYYVDRVEKKCPFMKDAAACEMLWKECGSIHARLAQQ